MKKETLIILFLIIILFGISFVFADVAPLPGQKICPRDFSCSSDQACVRGACLTDDGCVQTSEIGNTKCLDTNTEMVCSAVANRVYWNEVSCFSGESCYSNGQCSAVAKPASVVASGCGNWYDLRCQIKQVVSQIKNLFSSSTNSGSLVISCPSTSKKGDAILDPYTDAKIASCA